jgi:hypothetical protein
MPRIRGRGGFRSSWERALKPRGSFPARIVGDLRRHEASPDEGNRPRCPVCCYSAPCSPLPAPRSLLILAHHSSRSFTVFSNPISVGSYQLASRSTSGR